MFLLIFALVIIIVVAGVAVYDIIKTQGASRLAWCILALDVLIAILHRDIFKS